jgi:hypothetical protein
MEMFDFEKLKGVAVKEQYQIKIANRFVAFKTLYGNALGKVSETVSIFQ